MGAILKLLSGTAGIWFLIGGLLAAGAAGATGGYIARGVIDAPALSHQETLTAQADGRTKDCVAAHEKGRADGAEGVVTALTGAASKVNEAAAELDKKSATRDIATSRFLKELANAPKTSICGTAPAELAYRHSVRGDKSIPAVAP